MVPELELKATYGLVSPEEFTLPSPSPQWSADVYKAFDLSKLPTTNNEVLNHLLFSFYLEFFAFDSLKMSVILF